MRDRPRPPTAYDSLCPESFLNTLLGELEEVKIHLFTVVTTQGACLLRRRMVRTESREISGGERNIEGDVQGDCRKWRKTDEANVGFFGG